MRLTAPLSGGMRRSSPLMLTAFMAFSLVSLLGCGGGKTVVPTGEAAGRIRQLTLAYVKYAGTNKGVGPAKKEDLVKFIVKENAITEAEAEALFTSPRDNQPYVIVWAQKTHKPPTGEGAPEANVLIYEQEGADGTRFIGNGQMSVQQLPPDLFNQVVPNAGASGG